MRPGGRPARRVVGTGPADDRGSGTVLVIGLVAAVLVLAGSVGVLVASYRSAATVRTAADLAALAAADALALPIGVTQADDAAPPACERAGAVAERNGAALTGCDVGPGPVVVVGVERAGGPVPARAQARAGPASARG